MLPEKKRKKRGQWARWLRATDEGLLTAPAFKRLGLSLMDCMVAQWEGMPVCGRRGWGWPMTPQHQRESGGKAFR